MCTLRTSDQSTARSAGSATLSTAADAAEVLADGQLPPGEDALALPGAELLDELDEDEGPILERIREYVRKHPDKASAVIRYWLSPVQEEDRG